MRAAILAVIATGCAAHSSAAAAPVPVSPGAMHWVPERPTYVFASQTLDRGQRAVLAAFDLLSLVGIEASQVTQAVADVIHVDALRPDAVAAIGIDPRGGWAMFSEAVNPTLVVHLAAPDAWTAFLEREREHGLVTQSVIAQDRGSHARTEVVSASLGAGLRIRWAVVGDWLWVHLELPGVPDDGVAWFTASQAPHPAAPAADWAWAARAAGAAAGVVGYVQLRGAIAGAAARWPDAVACARRVEPIHRVAVAIEGDDHRAAARLAFDLGPTASLASHVLPPPGGWNATAARAAIAVAWNLDLPTVRTHLAPCLAAAGIDVSALDAVDATGVRAARGLVLDYDPDAASGSGALALDVSRATYFERQLDQIPLRRALERPRMFSGTRGVSLAIPFSVTVDYVLDDHRAITAMGDGVLARVLAPAAAPVRPPPIFALDLAPPALSPRAWAAIVQALRTQQLGPPAQDARRIAAQLSRWRTLHVGATLEPATDQLVLELVGERR